MGKTMVISTGNGSNPFYKMWIDEFSGINTRGVSMYPHTLMRGDRVRVRRGYDTEGSVGTYIGKANDELGKVVVAFNDVECILLDGAIEYFPPTYTEIRKKYGMSKDRFEELRRDLAEL